MPDVNELIATWVSLWSSYDLERVGELFLDQPDITYFSSEKEGVMIGLDAIVEHHRGFGFVEGGKEHGNKLWLEDTTITNLGNTVTVSSIWFFRKATGETMRGPVTFVCVQAGDTWFFAHVNFANYGR